MDSAYLCVSKFSNYFDRSKCKAELSRLSGGEVILVAYQPMFYVIAYPAGSRSGRLSAEDLPDRLSGGEVTLSRISRGFMLSPIRRGVTSFTRIKEVTKKMRPHEPGLRLPSASLSRYLRFRVCSD